ncbi:hypothetical protein CROQUDRAFT_129718 [Cronartium quercuum f. sp. fusiforme G11]|uniref:26S proteasome complex subunit SEM1 n=1 Tax=Cronartium quercuum f. sp. fusiforme G11 TaxID=708437 RepID=A0A9P6NYT3_9BASI|nr:hypothetical protein CROQUDRAFT_129718 [Cronartium quercuum f. sp. fusiforme G11]
MSTGSNNNNTTNATTSKPNSDPKQHTSPLDALGEDDEFEDFPVENWNESESDISHLIVGSKKSDEISNKKVTMEDLWEDNWDDEVPECDFAHQLRAELEKTKTGGNGPAPMQT